MGRPLKSDDKRRDFVMRVRLTASEKSRIEAKALDAGLTPSDLWRGLVLGNKPERNVPTPDRAALLNVLAELNKNGSNLNQIARELNRRQDSDDLRGFSVNNLAMVLQAHSELTKLITDILISGH